MSLPITVVGAGDNLVIPDTHAIANVAWTIAPTGFSHPVIGGLRAYDPIYNGGAVDFLFTESYTPGTPYVTLYFGTSLTQFSYGGGLGPETVGTASVENLAFGVFPAGLFSERVGSQKVYDPIYNGAGVDFLFVDAYDKPLTANVHFYFGTGALPITTAGGFQSSVVSVPLAYRDYKEALPTGIYAEVFGSAKVYDPIYNGATVDFLFVDAYTPPLASGVQLPFGTTLKRHLLEKGWLTEEFGDNSPTNAAHGIFPDGLYAETFGNTKFYDVQYNGATVDFNFVAYYEVPPTQNVAFYFVVPHGGVYVRAINFTPMSITYPIVTHWQQNVVPLSWTHGLLGSPTVYTLTQYIFPYMATESSRFGTPAYANFSKDLYPWGWTSSTLGDDVTIDNKARIVDLDEDGFLAVAFGTQYVAHYYQVLPYDYGFVSSAVGTPSLEFWVRTLYAQPTENPPSVMPPLVGRHVELLAEGFESSAFGTFIAYNGTPCWPIGWKSSTPASGDDTKIRLAWRMCPTQTIGATSIVERPLKVYNLIQYIKKAPYREFVDIDEAAYGTALVENFNKELKTFGHMDSRFAFYPADLIQPYQVIPATIAPNAFQKPIQVAFAIRYFPMDGIDSFVSEKWHVIYKTAKEVYPFGIAPTAEVGRPEEVVNRNRKFKMHWVLESMEIGTHMVADRIRKVYQTWPYRGETGGLDVDVRINPHPVAPQSWDEDTEGRHAAPYVEEHFTIAKCWGILPAWDPISKGTVVENRNRSYTPGVFLPLDHDQYGRARVEHWIRYVEPEGVVPSHAFGRQDIRDNKQYPSMAPSWISHKVPWTHKVEYTSITPYVLRRLYVGSLASTDEFGTASIPINELKPSGIAWVIPTGPVVRANSIFAKPAQTEVYINYNLWGFPTIAAPQWIFTTGIDVTAHQKQAVTPYTIYATNADPPVTEQVRLNHGYKEWYAPDWNWKTISGSNPYGQFGNLWAANKNRTIYHQTGGGMRPYTDAAGGLEVFGLYWVSNWKRWLYASGRKDSKFGRVDIPTSPRYMECWGSHESSAFGTPKIQYPEEVGYDAIRPLWINSYVTGNNSIELFNRNVYPSEFECETRTGRYIDGLDGIQLDPPTYMAPITDTQPPSIYVTRVGFPVLREFQGFTNSSPTAALVAYRIRNVYPEGTDMSELVYRLQRHFSRFRVYKVDPDPPYNDNPTKNVLPESILSSDIPSPAIYNWHLFVNYHWCMPSSDAPAPTVAHV